jgi:Tripartite tricarboxylate transporter TctB family
MSDPLPRRRLHLGELAVDLAIVVGSAFYVHAASNYPPQGRQIPTLVGWIAIAMGALHLVAHAVPRLWAVTHDSQARTRKTPEIPVPAVAARSTVEEVGRDAGPDGSGSARAEPAAAAAAAAPPVSLDVAPGAPLQVVVAIAWVVALLAGIYVFGFEVAIPGFFLVYFAALRAWRTALISAVAMWAVTWGLFVMALGVPLPQGLL